MSQNKAAPVEVIDAEFIDVEEHNPGNTEQYQNATDAYQQQMRDDEARRLAQYTEIKNQIAGASLLSGLCFVASVFCGAFSMFLHRSVVATVLTITFLILGFALEKHAKRLTRGIDYIR